MRWTEEQKKAIELRDKNILVAAAAGSGKTAVLVERIKRLILEERCPVDRMLIVTFTNAAAAEMKEKIRTSLNKAIAEIVENAEEEGRILRDEEKKDLAFLKTQIGLLSTAQISTFHAFALEVIRKYFYIIDVEPNFKICDEAQGALLKGDAMDMLLEECFEESSPEFIRFLKCYSGDRNEDKIRDIVDNAYTVIQSMPEPEEWLEEKVNILRDPRSNGGVILQFICNLVVDVLQEERSHIEAGMGAALDIGLTAAADLAKKDMDAIDAIIDVAKTHHYLNVKEALDKFKIDNLSKKLFVLEDDPEGAESLKKSFEKNRKGLKEAVTDLKKSYFPVSEDYLYEEIKATYEDALMLQKLVLRYGQIFSDLKKEQGLMDFSDIEHYAYAILKDPQVSESYRSHFVHIFIDEYQDSNVMQEAFVERIRREDNLFMVGDVKQSIYKFRLAEPEIFERRYADYGRDENLTSEKIDLNKNFRSKKSVIDFINEVFQYTMDGYDEKAQLYMGDPHGDESYHEPILYLASAPWEDDADIDDEIKTLMKVEKEALAAVKIIKDSIGQDYFDSKLGKVRKLTAGDIVILMRGIKNYGDIFYNILNENDISAYVDDNDGYFDTMEINTMLSLLTIMDNEKQDVPLLTVLRSEIFGFTIEELAAVRMADKDGSYHKAFMDYGKGEKENYPYDSKLREKIIKALEKLEGWEKKAVFMPLEELIWEILLESGFYIAMGAMPGGSQRQANLQALVDKALSFRQSQGGSLYGFIKYIDVVKRRKVATGQVKTAAEGEEMVRIMTIHKSKGLEFPMVIQTGFCRKLRYSTVGKSVMIHKDLGLAFPIVSPEKSWYKTTVLQEIMKAKFHQEEVSEEKRILYVAFTRAKDRLVLLGIDKDVQKALDKVGQEGASKSSYFHMTGNRICSRLGRYEIIEDRDLASLAKGRRRKSSEAAKLFKQNVSSQEPSLKEQVKRQLEFVYPYEKDMLLKSKYSVSELNSSGRRPVESLAEPSSFKSREAFSAMQKGSIFHCLLEHMDYKAVREEGINAVNREIDMLISEKFLTEEEAKTINCEYAVRLAMADLGGRIASSDKVYKERPFNLLHQVDGKDVIVQGIIDCYFEEDGKIVLLDYKTNWIDEKKDFEKEKQRIRDSYQTQIDLYREALEVSTGKQVKEAYIYLTNCGKIVEF